MEKEKQDDIKLREICINQAKALCDVRKNNIIQVAQEIYNWIKSENSSSQRYNPDWCELSYKCPHTACRLKVYICDGIKCVFDERLK